MIAILPVWYPRRSQAEAEQRADHPSFYADTFSVPPSGRWDFIRDELQAGHG
jgi:hypothetical protein